MRQYFEKRVYEERRLVLKEQVGHGLLLFLGNDEAGCNYADNTYDFRQDSTFLYYFGLSFANLAAIIDIDEDRQIIFGDELTIDDIVWMGPQPSLKDRAEIVGITDVRPLKDLKEYLDNASKRGQAINYLPTYRPEHQLKLQYLLDVHPQEEKPSVPFIRAVVAQRSIKSPEELEEIRFACDVTADMHITAMKMLRSGMKEYEVAAAIQYAAASQGCRLSFPTIATINGQTLHNHHYGNTCPSGRLLLVDAGAETPMGYAGDMSSTICIDPTYTSQQKAIYDAQLATHRAAVAALRPGIRYESVYDVACLTICEAMKGLGLMHGDMKEAVAAGAAAMFMPHGLGHMMGLDVHDMENLGEQWVGYNGEPKSTQFGRKSLRLARELEPGFCLTIEPGIYFIPELIDLWHKENKFAEFINYDELEKWRTFSGIRNEEDYLITETGSELLGKGKPMTTEQVEAIRNK